MNSGLAFGLGLSLVVPAGAAASDAPSAPPPRTGVRFALPEATGGRPVGSAELHLVDRERQDPWVADQARELMVSPGSPTRRGS
ncbi:hypothetical protein [Streptomyces diastaticus]